MQLVKTFKETQIIKKLFICLLGTVLLAISAKIKIPFYPVPMTMQTFAVLFIGVLYGWKLGVFTIFLYLLEGVIGLPVFSGTPEKGVGLLYFTGPTMGYLIGFIATVFVAGFVNYDKSVLKNFVKICFATSFIYLFGMLWLGTLIGWDKPIFELGAKPFLLAELFKILLLVLLLPKIRRFNQFI